MMLLWPQTAQSWRRMDWKTLTFPGHRFFYSSTETDKALLLNLELASLLTWKSSPGAMKDFQAKSTSLNNIHLSNPHRYMLCLVGMA